MSFIIPRLWRLSPKEQELFHVFLKRELVTRDAIMTSLYTDSPDPPEDKISGVMVYHLRKKVAAFGVEIVTRSGGWALLNRRSYTNDATADERIIAYNEGMLDALTNARNLFTSHADAIVAKLFEEIAGRREAYGIRCSHVMFDEEAAARALCIAAEMDPDKLVSRNDGREEQPLWTFRVDEARACMKAGVARPERSSESEAA